MLILNKIIMNCNNIYHGKFLKLLFTVLLFLIFHNEEILNSQSNFENEYITEVLSFKDISTNECRVVHQDSYGYLWFSTQIKLIKYDGYKAMEFINNSEDSVTFGVSMTSAIVEDKNRNLWIGGKSGDGLCRYIRNKEIFERILLPGKDIGIMKSAKVSALEMGVPGTIWVGTKGDGIIQIVQDKETNELTIKNLSELIAPYISVSELVINAILEDASKNLWLGTNDGLFQITLDKDNNPDYVTHFKYEKNDAGSISNNLIHCLEMEGDSVLWIGTQNGLNRINLHVFHEQKEDYPKINNDTFSSTINLFQKYYVSADSISEDNKNNILALCSASNGILWMGTEDKICYLKHAVKKIEEFDIEKRFLKYTNFEGEINDAKLFRKIIEDNNGTIWVVDENATFIIKIFPNRKRFRSFINEPGNLNSLSNSSILSVIEDGKGILWFGTDAGLNSFDRAKNIYTHYRPNKKIKGSISTDYVGGVFQDPYDNNILWVGTCVGRLSKFNKEIKYFTNYFIDPDNPKNSKSFNCVSAFPGTDKFLWVKTWGSGLVKFDKELESWEFFKNVLGDSASISDNNIMQVFYDSYGEMWVGTFNGLNRRIQNADSLKFKRYFHEPGNNKSLSNNHILKIMEDHAGNLWIGTFQGGLNKFNRKTEEFEHYSNIPNSETVITIMEDKKGYFWIGTPNGLVKWNKKNDYYRRYDKGDGLLNNGCGPLSFQSPSGEIFIFSKLGANSFYPKDIKDNEFVPPVAITKFLLFNETCTISKDSPLKKSLDLLKKIELNYDQNFISFEYAALNYIKPEKNQYKYMMDGLDREWVDAGTRRFANYSDLKPGNYTFKVIGSNNDGIWNNKGRSIEIVVHPPWWKTNFAYTSYIILTLFLIFLYIKIREKQLIKDKKVLEKTVKERTIEVVNQKEELSQQNDELVTTLDHLKQTQSQLVQSEKMASLGQLIAGIAHEINTPLGAIKSSISTISETMKQSYKVLPELFRKLPEELMKEFILLLNKSFESNGHYTTSEERKFKKTIIKKLEELKVKDTYNLADTLVDMGICEDITPFVTLLQDENAETILNSAYSLSIQYKNSLNIETAVNKASKVVFALKSYSRYGISESKVSANITEGIETVLILYQNQLKHGIEVKKNFETVPEIMCYPDELNQVWTNLIHNSIYAMQEKGKLEINVSKTDTAIIVKIKDNGTGIPDEIQDKIFDAFFTTKPTGEGSGLGLDIVKKIIEKHDGSIDFESEEGKGTEFRVVLPINHKNDA